MSERKGKTKKWKEGDLVLVKETGVLVRLITKEDDPELIDKDGYVYVEPVHPVDDWYHITDLVRP